MGRSSIFVFFFYSVFLSNAFANSFSVSGVSKESVVDGNTVKIYAGWANPGNCVTGTQDSVNACDSCTSASASIPCNKASIYGNLYFQITVDSSTANINGLAVQASTSSSLDSPITGLSSTVSGSQYTFKILWSSLCSALGSNAAGSTLGTDCGASVSGGSYATKTLYIGPVKDAKFVETITLEINLSAFGSSASNYTQCPEGVPAATEGVGCDYAVFPGDNKVYLDKFYHTWNTDSPATSLTAPVAAVAMFAKAASHTYAQAQASPALDVAVLQSITNSSDYYRLPVQAGDSPIEELKMEDLENDQRYCFIMATEDVTGNIAYFTSSTDYTTTPANALNLCATPSEVIGLLGDKSCFIATAAFGSALESHVQKFREFRNKFLLVSDWGRAFVRFYYKHSPPLAHWIAERDWAKKMTRSILWPAAVFVEIAYQWGLGWALLFSFAFVYFVIRLIQKLRNLFKQHSKGKI